jgi:hypothetical protein
MSNKYYVAHLKQFDNMESKQKYLLENDAFHITKREVKSILERYPEDRDVVCEDCGKYHSKTDSINEKLAKEAARK